MGVARVTVTAWLLVLLTCTVAGLVALAAADVLDTPEPDPTPRMHSASLPERKKEPTPGKWSAPLVPGYVRSFGRSSPPDA